MLLPVANAPHQPQNCKRSAAICRISCDCYVVLVWLFPSLNRTFEEVNSPAIFVIPICNYASINSVSRSKQFLHRFIVHSRFQFSPTFSLFHPSLGMTGSPVSLIEDNLDSSFRIRFFSSWISASILASSPVSSSVWIDLVCKSWLIPFVEQPEKAMLIQGEI